MATALRRTYLGVAGVAGSVLGRRSRTLTGVAGGAPVASSAFGRLAVFHAGVQSADDPKYTVEPQRARVSHRETADADNVH